MFNDILDRTTRSYTRYVQLYVRRVAVMMLLFVAVDVLRQ